jgi:alpha-L-rhamnosidase
MGSTTATSWKNEAGKLTLDVALPCNTTTMLYVPCADVAKVTESGTPATKAEGLKFLKMENGAAVFDAAPGTYKFKVE